MRSPLPRLAVFAISLGALATVSPTGEATASTPVPTLSARTASNPVPAPPVHRTLFGVPVLDSEPAAHSPLGRTETALSSLARSVGRLSHPEALRLAFQSYYRYRTANPHHVRKPYLYFVDYGLDSRTPRGYIFDMDALRLVDGPFQVAHGRGSEFGGERVPTRFSNRPGSNATSLGLYLAQEIYSFNGNSGGRSYRSIGLRLRGLSGRFNSTARSRGVVVHGAPYVTASSAGRSEGCPAMDQNRARRLIPMIAEGGLVFLFSPRDPNWLRTLS